MQLYEMFPCDLWNSLTVDDIQAYLKGEIDEKFYEYKSSKIERQVSERPPNKRLVL